MSRLFREAPVCRRRPQGKASAGAPSIDNGDAEVPAFESISLRYGQLACAPPPRRKGIPAALSPPSATSRSNLPLSRRSHSLRHPFTEGSAICGAGASRHHSATTEHEQGGNATHAELCRPARVRVDVDREEADVRLERGRDLSERRSHRAERPAPGRPEVDDDWDVAAPDLYRQHCVVDLCRATVGVLLQVGLREQALLIGRSPTTSPPKHLTRR